MSDVFTIADLEILNHLDTVIWIVDAREIWDPERSGLSNVWTNIAGLEFWNTPDLKSFQDKKIEPSDTHRDFLKTMWNRVVVNNEEIASTNTFHMHSPPRTVHLKIRQIRLKIQDGQEKILIMTHTIDFPEKETTETKRILLGHRMTQSMIQIFDLNGVLLHRNVAAERFELDNSAAMQGHFQTAQNVGQQGNQQDCGSQESALRRLFLFEQDYDSMMQALMQNKQKVYRCTCRVPALGHLLRWHTMDINRTQDSVTGDDVIVVSAIDTTAVRELEHQLHMTQIAKEQEVMKQIVAHKDQILASVSHEMRTPLNGIIGMSDALISDMDAMGADASDGIKKALNTIYQSGYRLLHLLNDVLDMSKLRTKKIQLVYEEFDLARY
jgi:hypothetical protein